MNEERLRRSRSFGAVARAYDEFRPGPPPESLALYGDLKDRDVLELGAGTGLVTRFLVGLAANVTTVEPDDNMRLVLEERSPEVQSLNTVAQSLPLADASMDVVIASSAWHWFPQPETSVEVARVLRDGGRLLIVGNGIDTGVEWTASIGALRQHGTDLTDRNYVASVPAQGPFEVVRHEECSYLWTRTPAQVVGLFNTYSATLIKTPEEREHLSLEVETLLAGHVSGGAVQLPMMMTFMEFRRLER